MITLIEVIIQNTIRVDRNYNYSILINIGITGTKANNAHAKNNAILFQIQLILLIPSPLIQLYDTNNRVLILYVLLFLPDLSLLLLLQVKYHPPLL